MTGRRGTGSVGVAALVAMLAAASSAEEGGDHAAAIEAWRQQRVERLTGENGWLTLAGLHWLEPGRSSFGSDPTNDIPLPAEAPAFAGEILLEGTELRLRPGPEAGILLDGEPVGGARLRSDAEGAPTVLTMGDLTFYPIRRGDRFLLRVKDRAHPARTGFTGIDYFPIREEWRLDARFEPHSQADGSPRKIPVANVLGQLTETPSWGALVFEAGGETHRLDVLAQPGDEELFVIFADQTNGAETYGAGRYLYAPAPDAAGRVELDFNKAYNPPCAFTPYATCPLPPRQNRLQLPVEAGEKDYRGPH